METNNQNQQGSTIVTKVTNKQNLKPILIIGGSIMALLITYSLGHYGGDSACKSTDTYKKGEVVEVKEEAEEKIDEAETTIQANEKVVQEATAFLMGTATAQK